MHIIHTLRQVAIDLNGGGGIRGQYESREDGDKTVFHHRYSTTASDTTGIVTPS